jgi:transcription elongation factor Elf1
MVECPYCGEHYSTQVDLSAGSASYVEDCQVCCQPIELELSVGERGALERVTARRGD